MNRSAFLLASLLAFFPGALPGCHRAELSGPPELRLGRDECVECGMIINEDRCSAAMLREREGVREHAMFDDIGCMLDHDHEHASEYRVIERYVHDHSTRRWIPAASASYLLADHEKLPTPMGSGIIALTDRAAAEQVRDRVGGEILDQTGLVTARRAWMVARYGVPKDAP